MIRRALLSTFCIFLALCPAAESRLSHRQIRQAATHWAEWIAGDTGEVGYFIGRCSRTRCRARLTGTEFGDCVATVYIRRKRGRVQESEIVYRRRWVVGVTDVGLDCQ